MKEVSADGMTFEKFDIEKEFTLAHVAIARPLFVKILNNIDNTFYFAELLGVCLRPMNQKTFNEIEYLKYVKKLKTVKYSVELQDLYDELCLVFIKKLTPIVAKSIQTSSNLRELYQTEEEKLKNLNETDGT